MIAEDLHRSALATIEEMKTATNQLIGSVPDPVARLLIRTQIDEFEHEWRAFVFHHFGICLEHKTDGTRNQNTSIF